jgi:hypothetical protein
LPLGVLRDEVDGGVEALEVPLREDRHTRGLHLLLAEVAVLLEAVGVRRAPHDRLPLLAELLGQRAVVGVVEDDDVRPVLVLLPRVDLRDEPVADVLVRLRLDVVLRLVPFLDDFPGEIVDEPHAGDEEEFHRRLLYR